MGLWINWSTAVQGSSPGHYVIVFLDNTCDSNYIASLHPGVQMAADNLKNVDGR